MSKTKSNSGNEFNESELGNELPVEKPSTKVDDFAPEPSAPRIAQRPKGKYLAAGGDIHEFKNEGDTFIGRYTGRKLVREKDGKEDGQKAGDVMGYYFEDPNGRPTVIGNSHQIEKSVNAIKEGSVLWIEFLGSKDLGAGRKVNQFDIIEVDQEDYKNYGF